MFLFCPFYFLSPFVVFFFCSGAGYTKTPLLISITVVGVGRVFYCSGGAAVCLGSGSVGSGLNGPSSPLPGGFLWVFAFIIFTGVYFYIYWPRG